MTKKQELGNKLLNRTGGWGTAFEYRKKSRLGALRRPELSSWVQLSSRRPSPGRARGLRRCTPVGTSIEYRKKSHDCGSTAKEEPRPRACGSAPLPESGSSIVCPGAPPCPAVAVPRRRCTPAGTAIEYRKKSRLGALCIAAAILYSIPVPGRAHRQGPGARPLHLLLLVTNAKLMKKTVQ